MTNRILLSCIIFFSLLVEVSAQSRLLTIDEMFQLADQNNKSLQLHDLAIDEAEQAIKVAYNDRLPSIQALVELKYIGDGVMTDRDFSNAIHADMPHFGNTFVLKASQVIYAGGAITRNIRQSKLKKQEAEWIHADSKQDIRFLLTGYYLDLFQLNNQKRVYENNIEQTRLLVKDMRAAYKQGTALKSDITRYELQLQNLELSLTSVKDRLDVINYELATAIGLEPGIKILPDTAELFKVNIEKGVENDWQEKIPYTPDIQLAQVKIEQAKNKFELIKAERRPKINLTVANDFAGPILVEVPPMNNNFNYWYAGIGISYNIDALFKTKKKLKQAKISTWKMEQARKVAEEEAENAIHKAYVNLNEAYIRLRTQKKSVQLAHENFNIVRQRYVNGLALVTDMLDASNTQLDMELQLANYQIGILYQYYLLKKLTGNL